MKNRNVVTFLVFCFSIVFLFYCGEHFHWWKSSVKTKEDLLSGAVCHLHKRRLMTKRKRDDDSRDDVATENEEPEELLTEEQFKPEEPLTEEHFKIAWWNAVRCGYEKTLQYLLDNKNDDAFDLLNATNADGETALHVAIHSNTWDKVFPSLLEWRADVNIVDDSSLTPLFWAISCGYDGAVELLLEWGAKVNIVDDKRRTPLFWAIECGYDGAVKLLLQSGAYVNIVDDESRTPLFWAIICGYDGAVKLLVEARQPNILQTQRYNGLTPLKFAIRIRSGDMVQLLFKLGAVIDEDTLEFARAIKCVSVVNTLQFLEDHFDPRPHLR